MLNQEIKHRIDAARQILVGKIPDPKAQVEQITTAMIYKFMDDMDRDAEELGGEARYFVDDLKEFSWGRLLSKELSGQERLDTYIRAIVALSKSQQIPGLFRTIFKDAFLPYRDPETLNLFLKEINGFTYENSENIGNAFEYLLSVLGSQGDAGQFRTPRHIIDFIVEVIAPKKGETILDPACGTAGFLISAYKHIKRIYSSNFIEEEYVPTFAETDNRDITTVEIQKNGKYKADRLTLDDKKKLAQNIVGYDISPDMVRLSLVNLYLHDFNSPQIFEYDTLTYEDRWDDDFDVILANPPFMTPTGGIRPHERFQVQAKRSEVLFVDYIAEHLSINGRAGIIVPEGIIFQSANAYKNLRKMLVENDLLWAVVSLPSGVFNPYSGVKTSILLLDKQLAKETDKVLFVKIENDGFDLGAQRRRIQKNDLPAAYTCLQHYQAHQSLERFAERTIGAHTVSPDDIARIAHTVPRERIAESGEYNLSGERYRTRETVANGKWEMVELGEVCEILNGYAFDAGKFNHDWIGMPIVRIRDINSWFSNTYYNGNYEEKYLIHDGDLLIWMDWDFRIKIWKHGPALLNQRVCKLHSFENVIQSFVSLFIQKELDKIHSETFAVTVKHLSSRQISKIKIPLPPLAVQEQIVTEIDGYQRVIDGARQVVESWKPSIKIDPEWEMVELGDRVNFQNWFAFESQKYIKQGYQIIRITNVQKGYIDNKNQKFYPENELKWLENFILQSGDLLMSLTGNVWRVGVLQKEQLPAVLNQRVAKLEIKNQQLLDKKYLFHILNTDSFEKDAIDLASGIAQKNLWTTALKKYKIPLPPLAVQEQIVAEIEAERQSVEACRDLIARYEARIRDRIAEVWGG